MHDLSNEQSSLSVHSIRTQFTFGSPFVFGGHSQIGECATVAQIAFSPHKLESSQGFRHLESLQAALFGQSLSVKHSPGLLHPVTTGSPTEPSGHEQMKLPGTF
jgi:hypothetical protein